MLKKIIPFILVAPLFLSACAVSDLRNNVITRSEPSDKMMMQGKEILKEALMKHDPYNRRNLFKKSSIVFSDQTDGSWLHHLTGSVDEYQKLKLILEKNDNWMFSASNQDQKLSYQFKDGKLEKVNTAGEKSKLSQLDGFKILPYYKSLSFLIKLKPLDYVYYFDERVVESQAYFRIFMSNKENPSRGDDQYILYVNQETMRIERVDLTIRDLLSFYKGEIYFDDFRTVEEIELPFAVRIVSLVSNDSPIHNVTVNSYQFSR